MAVDKEKLQKLADDPAEKELSEIVTKEVMIQFYAFVDNYKQMVEQYPLLNATTCLVAQLRVFGQDAATLVVGGASQVHQALIDLDMLTRGGLEDD